jgi:D-alanine-D-alanine ligase
VTRRTLAIVFGGASPEHDVSVMSARGIFGNLDAGRYEVLLVGVDREGVPRAGGPSLLEGGLGRGEGTPVRWPCSGVDRTLRAESTGEPVSAPLDVVFPIIHGAGGEDGTLQGVFELAGIPCVGAGVLGSSLAMDKEAARRLLAAGGFPVPQTVVLRPPELATPESWTRLVETMGLPLFVKPSRAGSSVGITKVSELAGLAPAIETASAIDSKVLIERAVPKPREIEVAVLGLDEPESSVPGEIVPRREFYDYRAKYEDPESELLVPAPLEAGMAERVRAIAVDAFRALELAGMARVDFLLSGIDGSLVVSEVNTLPGFTPISMYPRLWQASGLSYAALLDRLVDLAIEAAPRSPLHPSR